MRVAAAALSYFAVVFGVGFLLGPIRVLVLEPRVGPALAVAIEVPLLLAAMAWSARWITRRIGLAPTVRELLAMGLGALMLQQMADLALGIALRGLTPLDQLRNFATPAGAIYAASLVAFALMPLILNRRA